MRFLLYADHSLVDANVPTLAALCERLRLLIDARPSGVRDLYVLVFDRSTDRYLGRRDVVVEEGVPVFVCPEAGRCPL